MTAEFCSGKRVLVTGHTGFKGSWLCLALLDAGAHVTGVSDAVAASPTLFETLALQGELDDRRQDVRDADGLARIVEQVRPDIVLHLAAQPYVRRSYREPVETYATNVMGTVHLLDAIRRFPSARSVVVVTSDKCYDNSARDRPFVESDPMGGHDPYSNSKGCSELVTDAYRRSYFGDPDGPRVASGRAGNVIGGGDWGEDRLVPDMMRGAVADELIAVRNPSAVRPWQHVLNPLSGYLRLAELLAAGEDVASGFNFGPRPNDVLPVSHLVERLTELWPGELRWEVGAAQAVHEAAFLSLDSTLAGERLRWAPTWDLEAALRSIVEWYVGLQEGADMHALSLEQLHRFTRDAAAAAT